MDQKSIYDINFDRISEWGSLDYKNDEIAFHTGIRCFPTSNYSIRTDMFVIFGCSTGKMNIEINATPRIMYADNLLVLHPNDIVDNCMVSPDFEGFILCLSQRGILEQFSSTELWDRAFQFVENPVIPVGKDINHLIRLYGEILKMKIKMERTVYQKEIIMSLVHAMLYELLAYTEKPGAPVYGKGLVKQRDVLFKRFLRLLSESQIKSRFVSTYAAKLCITPKHLSSVCKQVSGKTALAWINECISKDIRYWLKNSDKSIKEIAAMLDFPNISFFGKYCRSHCGASPVQLRKQLRTNQVQD